MKLILATILLLGLIGHSQMQMLTQTDDHYGQQQQQQQQQQDQPTRSTVRLSDRLRQHGRRLISNWHSSSTRGDSMRSPRFMNDVGPMNQMSQADGRNGGGNLPRQSGGREQSLQQLDDRMMSCRNKEDNGNIADEEDGLLVRFADDELRRKGDYTPNKAIADEASNGLQQEQPQQQQQASDNTNYNWRRQLVQPSFEGFRRLSLDDLLNNNNRQQQQQQQPFGSSNYDSLDLEKMLRDLNRQLDPLRRQLLNSSQNGRLRIKIIQ